MSDHRRALRSMQVRVHMVHPVKDLYDLHSTITPTEFGVLPGGTLQVHWTECRLLLDEEIVWVD